MRMGHSRLIWTVGMLGVSMAALAGPGLEDSKPAQPHEPVGFITGGVIGAFAAGPIGAVIGAGLGTWLGNRVHRAGDAAKAEAQVAGLQAETVALAGAKGDLAETNRALTARLDQLSHSVEAAQSAKDEAVRDQAATVLDGLQGDVLFRTGSADITPEMTLSIQAMAEAVAKSPSLKVRVDGYADPRGSVDGNLKLSEARADAVRDLFLAAGVSDDALEINAYGKSRSVADDVDGFALERRVRLTLLAPVAAAVAQSGAAPNALSTAAEALQVTENE